MSREKKKLLLVLRHAPYGNRLARAALDVALATAALAQDVTLLFMDDGVWQLLPGQDAAPLSAKTHLKTLQSLPLYDIDTFYVEAASLRRRNLDGAALDGNIVLLEDEKLGKFIDEFDQVLGF